MAAGKADLKWKEKVLAWQASGKSVSVWCLENQISTTTFYGWRARLEKSPKDLTKPKDMKVKQEFVELKDQQSCDAGIILEYEGVKIHLQANFDQLILKRCLDCLRGAQC